jgi:hypothetical protein
METVDGSLRCKYCQYFYDMNKEWIDFVHKKQEKQDGIQTIKHLLQDDGTAHAVDLMAYQDGEPCWEIQVYDEIADAMKEAAVRTGTKIRWGAAWQIDDLRDWDGTAEEAMNAYIDLRRSQGRRPFIDGPHFEKN